MAARMLPGAGGDQLTDIVADVVLVTIIEVGLSEAANKKDE